MLAKTKTAKEMLDIFRTVSVSAITIAACAASFIPQWIIDTFGVDALFVKCDCIIFGVIIGYTLTTVIRNMLLEAYNKQLIHEAYALRQALIDEEEIDLTDEEIKDVIDRLNSIIEDYDDD